MMGGPRVDIATTSRDQVEQVAAAQTHQSQVLPKHETANT